MTDNDMPEGRGAPDPDGARGAFEDPAAAAGPHPLVELGETAKSAEAELFPPSAEAHAEEEDADGPVRASDPPGTFASADAPWVGAEKKWLKGEGDEPEKEPPAPGERAEEVAKAFPMLGSDEDDDALLVAPQVPVLQSIIPPPPSGVGLGFKLGIAAVLLVVLGAAAMVWWMNQRFSEREQEILALHESDKQNVARLESQIRELLAKGGAENEARANELRIELRAAREEAAAEADTEDTDAERRHRRRRDTDGAGAAAGEVATAAEPAAAARPAGGAGPTGDSPTAAAPVEADLLDNALKRPQPAAAAAPTPTQGGAEFPLGGTELPQSPSREQVKAAMDSIGPQVRSCGQGGGRIVVSLAVAGATGRVLSAEPTGDAAGTPLGLCAARAVKLAKFPAFRQDRLQIKYPFDL